MKNVLYLFSAKNHFISSILVIFLIQISGLTINAQSYCTENLTYYGCISYSAIDDFHLSNVNQIATGCTEGTGIADFTGETCFLAQGEPYLFTYTTNTPEYSINSDQLGIWIDYNDDYDFDDVGEFIYGMPAGGLRSDLITVSSTAILGMHRMRVRCVNDYYPITSSQSCYPYYYYGETHDYTANIVPPPPCPAISALTVSDISMHEAAVNIQCNDCTGPFVLEYGLKGFSPGFGPDAGVDGTIVNVGELSDFPVVLGNLNASSDYQVYVRRNCDLDGYSVNFGPIGFITDYDACATLTEIMCGIPVNANIAAGYGQFDTTACSLNTGKELLYSFIADQTGIYTITIVETNYSYASYLVKEAAVGCNADGWSCGQVTPWTTYFSSPGTIILDTLTAGTTYYLCIDALYFFQSVNHTFRIDCHEPFNPCDSVTTITCGDQQHVMIPSGLGALTDYNYDYSLNYGKEKIYKFTPEITGSYSITLSASSNSSAIYYSFKKASDGCNENEWHFITGMGGWGNYTPFAGTLVAGTEYYFLADASGMEGAEQYFQVNCLTPSEPCAEIDTITCGTTINLNIPSGAGKFTLPACPNTWFNQPFAGKEQLYLFTPETSGYSALHIFNYFEPNWDNYLYYYVKPASSGCNDENWSCLGVGYPGYYKIPFFLNTGESYFIMVDALQLMGNTQNIEITCPEPWEPCNTITEIYCTTPVTASIPTGLGKFDSLFYDRSNASIGKELIYSFTPDMGGTYAINVTATDYKQVKYLILDGSNGCIDEGWEYLSMLSYPTSWQSLYMPYPLTAGNTYYLMLDAGDPTGATHTFELQCVYPADPCSNITSITCGSVNTVINEHGLGLFDPYYENYGHFPGRETIFEFTPTVTGNHLLVVLSATGYNMVGYFIKPANDGCNNDNWIFIKGAYYQMVAGIPISLNAGESYYIMADSYTEGQTFQIICPTESYDYCTTLETINSCDTEVSFTIPPGLGGFGIPHGCNDVVTYGKEKLFSFTPDESGYYGLKVIGETNGSVSYFMKHANGGCSVGDWNCIGNFDFYGGDVRMPYPFAAGETYYILIDAADTLGVSKTFKILCTPSDPCLNIDNLASCGNYQMITLPYGFNSYDLGGCGNNYQTQNSPDGSMKIFSFTPEEDGINQLSTIYLYNATNIRFFIRPASSGCGEQGWTCIDYDSYSWRAILPYQLIKDTAYYVLVVNEFLWPTSEFGFAFDCPSPCLQFKDNDFDGYGDDNEKLYTCFATFGFVYEGGDCDDYNSQIYPGAPEITDNIDNDCDGQIDECIEVPIVTCPGDLFVCSGDTPFQLTEGEPQNGTFSGAGVTGGIFYPSIAGPGEHQISYCFTNELGCMNCCQFNIIVIESQTITLPSGWSGISSYVEPLNTDIVEMFDPVLNNLIVMYNYSNVYFPGGGINPAELWDSHSGYVIKMDQSDELVICGTSIENTTIGLSQGWNIIPVLSDGPIDVAGMFGDISDVDFVTEVAGNKIYWKQYGINSLIALEPGKSYLVHSTNNLSATFPTGGDEGIKNPVFIKTAPWNDVSLTNTNHIFAFTENAFREISPGNEIGVFRSNGQCVGMMTFTGNDKGLGVIANGDDQYTSIIEGFLPGEPVFIKMFNQATNEVCNLEVEYDNSAPDNNTFAMNGISVITQIKQSALQVEDESLTGISIYPNPTNDFLLIEGITTPTEVTVYRPFGNIITTISLSGSGKIDLSDQPAGIFLIRLSNNHDVIYRKIVKE